MGELETLFKESGFTLTEVSKLSKISLSTVYNYIKGQVKNPNPDYYEPIYKVLTGIHTENDSSSELTDKQVIKENIQKIVDAQASDSEYSDEIGIDPDKVKAAIEGNALKTNYSSHAQHTHFPVQPKRMEIWYVKSQQTTGKEIWSGSTNRPCIVIQNPKLSNIGTYVCIYMTKQPKEAENPSFVTIQTNVVSTAICSQVYAISEDRFVNKVGTITENEMFLIERAILNVLDIKVNPKSELYHVPDYISLKTELSVYKKFYDDYIRIQLNDK